ncbi:RING/FYVE/PHD zinc finger superfamily protein [Actinidia rufa]|uniref:RING/FYVE/PHD zinc finger superfamily protein n=1 Tax=Actinidia rufa TaxID=165716 RepID=A0A7J0DRK2_9ERIC|nr:RING/FYVE/PHD zinc finger superfamily protein [Actinidia rufa]
MGVTKLKSSGLATISNTNVFVKLNKKDSEEKGSRKRYAENIEVASAVKRQVLELTVGSPKTSSLGRIAALSRDSSFKTLNKEKVKPVHPLSSGICVTNNSAKASLSLTGS